ncbi:MAG: hypothetical protein LBD55_10790 [Treponema sp.]|jgi:hypothetical protein|nr:hypothetical protein [Treponema sp.]
MVEWKKEDGFTVEVSHERLDRVSREDCNTGTQYEGTGKRERKALSETAKFRLKVSGC